MGTVCRALYTFDQPARQARDQASWPRSAGRTYQACQEPFEVRFDRRTVHLELHCEIVELRGGLRKVLVRQEPRSEFREASAVPLVSGRQDARGQMAVDAPRPMLTSGKGHQLLEEHSEPRVAAIQSQLQSKSMRVCE